jgi:iron-sulfur cluster assembly protein
MFDPNKPLLTLSDKAAEHVRGLVEKGGDGVIGIRVGIKTAGCSGMKYQVEYAYDKKQFEDTITEKGVTVLIDPAAVMFIIGSEMDWSDDKFSSGFIFNNPNETARCGCGESFSVA